jgi:hypothetical protein
MSRFLRAYVVFLILAAFTFGCGKSDPTPRAIDIKPDPRLQRVGEGNPNPDKKEGNQSALP